MNPLVTVLLAFAGMGAFALLWRLAPRDLQPGKDPTGVRGHQGRCVAWLDSAPTDAATPPQQWVGGPRTPADRVLAAILLRHAGGGATDLSPVLEELVRARPDGIAATLATGQMGRAARMAARKRYRGPPGLFPIWYVLVYRIRRGPRGIHLDILCQALEEQP